MRRAALALGLVIGLTACSSAKPLIDTPTDVPLESLVDPARATPWRRLAYADVNTLAVAGDGGLVGLVDLHSNALTRKTFETDTTPWLQGRGAIVLHDNSLSDHA